MEILPLVMGMFCFLIGTVSAKIAQKFSEEGNRPWARVFLLLTILSVLDVGFIGAVFIFAAMTFDATIESVMFLTGLILGFLLARKITVTHVSSPHTECPPAAE